MGKGAATMRWHWDCLIWIREYPVIAGIVILLGVVCGVGVPSGYYYFIERTRPIPNKIVNLTITSRGDGGGAWLVGDFHARSPGDCVRINSPLMYHDIGDQRIYFPMPSTISGSGLVGSVYDYTTWWALPSGLPKGKWTFLLRQYYECPPSGLVLWPVTSEPREIVIP